MALSRTAAVVSLVLAFTAGVTAQYSPGDVIYARISPALWAITPQLSFFPLKARLANPITDVMPSLDNRTVYAAINTYPPAAILDVASDGTTTTVVSGFYHWMQHDEEGGILAGGWAGVVQVDRFGVATTLLAQPRFQGRIDLATGDLILFGNVVERLRLAPPRPLTTIIALDNWQLANRGAEYDPVTATMICVAGSTGNRLVRFDLAGNRLTTLATFPRGVYLGPPRLDSADRGMLVPLWDSQRRVTSSILRLDPRTATLSTFFASSTAISWASVATVAGSRRLAPLGPAVRGGRFQMRISVPADSGALYLVALSFGFTGGIPVGGGRRILLQPDALFALSRSGSPIFSGFTGRLSATGDGQAAIAIPGAASLAGLRFYAAAITVVNNNIREITDPIGVTIR